MIHAHGQALPTADLNCPDHFFKELSRTIFGTKYQKEKSKRKGERKTRKVWKEGRKGCEAGSIIGGIRKEPEPKRKRRKTGQPYFAQRSKAKSHLERWRRY